MNRRELLRTALAATVAPLVPAVTNREVVEIVTPDDSEMLPDIDIEVWIRDAVRDEMNKAYANFFGPICLHGDGISPEPTEQESIEIVLRTLRNTIGPNRENT